MKNINLFFALCCFALQVFAVDENGGDRRLKIYESQDAVNLAVSESAAKHFQSINAHWRYSNGDEARAIESQDWAIIWFTVYGRGSVPGLMYSGENNVHSFLDALRALPKTRAIAECGLAQQAVKALVLWDVMGDEAFTKHLEQIVKVHANDLQSRLKPEQNAFRSAGFLTILCNQIDLKKMEMPFEKTHNHNALGAFAYFKNIREYSKLVEKGSYCGDNVICIGDDLYVGFGDFYAEPKSKKQIYDAFYSHLMDNNEQEFLRLYPTKEEYLQALRGIQDIQDQTSSHDFISCDRLSRKL